MDLKNSQHQLNEQLIFAAEKNESFTLFEQLLQAGADPNATNAIGSSPLHLVLKNKYSHKNNVDNKVHLLLDKGARPDIQDSYGFTPFHMVANYGDLELCTTLVDSVKKIDWAFKAIKPMLLINNRYKALNKHLPKQVLLLIFKQVTHANITKKRTEYPTLSGSLIKKRTECMIYQNIISKTAYDLACEKQEEAKKRNEQALAMKLEQIKWLVNPENYK